VTGPITRDSARRAALAELRKPEYHRHPFRPSRIPVDIAHWLGRVWTALTQHTPGGALTVLGVLAFGALAVALARHHRLPARAARPAETDGEPRPLTPAELRRRAEAAAAAGKWAAAIADRMRAVAAELSARALLDLQPSRTAGEIAAEGGRRLPSAAAQLQRAAHTFDAVRYGGRSAGAAEYGAVRAADDAVRGNG
jgi:hypothetical protein